MEGKSFKVVNVMLKVIFSLAFLFVHYFYTNVKNDYFQFNLYKIPYFYVKIHENFNIKNKISRIINN